MRQIGNLPNEAQARAFADHLVGSGIRNEVEPDSDGSWMIWIRDDDHLAIAQETLKRFQADPNAAEFRDAASSAAKARAAEAADLEAYRRRLKSRRSLFPKFGGHGIGILTYVLIFGCLVVAFYTRTGFNHNPELVHHLFISETQEGTARTLPEVRSGEVWRLLTPILIHGDIFHLLFNMLWLFQLGCMIEGRQGTNYLALLVAVTGILSNLAQYYIHHAAFGGMSGVVYALAGYAWMRGKYDPKAGVDLDPQSVTFMLIWLVVCFTGLVGPVANTAHLVGLVSGAAWGRIAAYFAARN